MPIDQDEAVAWTDAVEDALIESVDRHGLDPDVLMDADSATGRRFIESLDELVDSDPEDPAFARAVEAVALEFAEANPDLRVTEAEDVETVEGRVLEAKGTNPDGGRVFRVEILRYGDSKNGNRYTEAVMRRDAHRYEGAKAYDHHRSAEELRSSTLTGLVGSYRNVEATTTALEGDLHLLPSASHTAEALEASLQAQAAGLPPLVGISHDVMASFKPTQLAGGRRVREAVAITSVQSADVVADPSAGGRAVRVVQGGIETTPSGAEPTQESEVQANDQLAAVLQTLTPEQLAAAGLSRAGTNTTESVTPPERTVESQRTTEAGQPKTSFLGRMLIRAKVEDAGLPVSVVESFTSNLPDVVTEADVDLAIAGLKSSLAIAERAGLTPTVTTHVTREATDKKVAALDAFFSQDFAKGYRSFREAYVDFTGRAPRAFGEDVNRMILRESFGGGFGSGSYRTTESLDSTSWAQVLGDSVTRRMVAAYAHPSLQNWRQIVSSMPPIPDFRTVRIDRMGGYGTLPTVLEGGPYQPLTSPGDEEVTYTLTKKGGTEDLTLEMIANDDVRAISNIPGRLGLAASRTLHNFVWDFLSTNPNIYDGSALFVAGHSNTTAAALSQTNLSTLRALMRNQTAYGDTSDILSLTPRFLIVPNELEEIAFQLVTSAVAIPATPAGAADTPNLHQGMSHIVVDYFTDANDWFLAADPSMCPTIEIGFYQGRQEPELFTQSDNTVGSMFNSDSLTYKIRHIYYGAVLDYRGFQRGTQ